MFETILVTALSLGQAPMPMQPAANPPAQPAPEASPLNVIFEPNMRQEPRTTTIVGTPYPFKAASDEEESSPFSGSVTLNQDSFFGFYPILNGSYALNDRFALTFYGLFWTNPGFTPSGRGGTGLWTEFAGGISFSILDGLISLNPAVGFLNGRLLSGADRANAFEGIVAQLNISHADKYTEAQVFGAYYVSTAAPSNNNFAHYWVTGGIRPFADNSNWTQILSTGVHFEQLFQTKAKEGTTGNIYTWIGPYLQLTLPNDVFLRINAGWDTQDSVSGTFYKATMGFAF